MKNVIDDPSMYRKFKYRYAQIGSTKYRITYYSDEFATVSIKHLSDTKWRDIQDFYGEDAHTDAYAFVLKETSN